jgi:hypothetical protein
MMGTRRKSQKFLLLILPEKKKTGPLMLSLSLAAWN